LRPMPARPNGATANSQGREPLGGVSPWEGDVNDILHILASTEPQRGDRQ
jgi:hypothetical protein